MSASYMRYLYAVHQSKMIAQNATCLTYPRFVEILNGLGF